jgi:hypothetical protein
MRPVRLLTALLILVASAATAYETVVVSYRCNQRLKVAKTATRKALANEGRASALLATESISILATCPEWCDGNVDALMVLAANNRVLRRPDETLALYDRALELDRRPELYFERAMTEFESGRPARIEDILKAVKFHVGYYYALPDALRAEVDERIATPGGDP